MAPTVCSERSEDKCCAQKHNIVSGLFCSYSIILLEIATRSDPIPVSRPSCVTWPANRLLLFRVSGGLLRKTMCFRLRSQMWRAHGVLLCLSSSPLRPTAPVPVQLTTWRYVHPKLWSFDVALFIVHLLFKSGQMLFMQQAWKISLLSVQVHWIKLFNEPHIGFLIACYIGITFI